MRPAAIALLFTLFAALLATPLPCVPDCCRGGDGSAMAACPMNASSSGPCQFRGCSPESGATPTLIAHVAVMPGTPPKTVLAASRTRSLPEAARVLSAFPDPAIPPPRG